MQFGLDLANSRLDFELAVARIEFSDTPKWLQALNDDPCGFPKKTLLGTIWKWVDTTAVDQAGQTEFIRAVMDSNNIIHYVEMLAEFEDIDVNLQDKQGRTALHWACARNFPVMVMLCLSVPTCDVGLRDSDNRTAFDISYQTGKTQIPTLFYKNIFEIDEQTSLLRLLTMASKHRDNKPIFPGDAMFDPIETRNKPLVKALIDRGIDLTVRNIHGYTALHVAAAKADNTEIATMLLKAGEMVKLLLFWDVDGTVRDMDGMLAIDLARKNGRMDIMRLLLNFVSDGTRNKQRGGELVRIPKSVQGTGMEIVGVFPELGAGTEAINKEKQISAHPATENNNHAIIDTPPACGVEIHPLHSMSNRGYERVSREFRILYRPPSAISPRVVRQPERKGPMRRKIARALGQSSNHITLIDEAMSKFAERSGHWALVILGPESDPPELNNLPPLTRIRRPILADDPRIERVFEIGRKERSAKPKRNPQEGEVSMVQRPSRPLIPRPPTPSDSDQEDRYESDLGFPEVNEKGNNFQLTVGLKPRHDFSKLLWEHLEGPVWEILTDVEARTKLTNSELKHEANRLWKRQQNYHLLDNNCHQFCILLAIKIRARNHALLRILEGEIVRRQMERMT
ncbi:Serine/threonine-protein phosphatase 6 regulatory ankyrin repeat subunit A [Maublancomyces gigas]|uniref:Serine/threonine-protein phosphatase 6 regulatory ankyrin repeat subunit A n=1 Tax=Discina gigas TaxID=1032678 RepID=A0ABR3G7D7_9PEZI